MNVQIAKLVTILTCNSSHFNKNVWKSGKESRKFRTETQKTNTALKSMGKWFKAAAVAAAAMKIGQSLKGEIAAIDKLAKTSRKLGVTTAELTKLRYAASLSGVEVRTLDMAIQRMTRRLAEAALGTGEAKAAIKELGLNARLLSAAGPTQAFMKIARAMQLVESQAHRVRLSFKLFDSEGVALVNTLAMGESGLRAAGREAERLGLVVRKSLVKAMEDASDSFLRLESFLTGLKRKAVSIIEIWDRMRQDLGTSIDVSTGTPVENEHSRLLSLVEESERLYGVWAKARKEEQRLASMAVWNQPLNVKAVRASARARANAAMSQMIAIDAEAEVLGRRVAFLNTIRREYRPGPGGYDLFGGIGTGFQKAKEGFGRAAFEVAFGWRSATRSLQIYRAELNKRLSAEKEQRTLWKDIGKAMAESVMTPMERYTQAIDETGEALKRGAIGWKTYGRVVARAREQLESSTSMADVTRPALPQAIREGSTEAAIAAYEAANPIRHDPAITNRLDKANEYAEESRDHLRDIVDNTAALEDGEDFAP